MTTNMGPGRRVARFQVFRGTFATWDTLFNQAAEFATNIGPDRLITIAHSEDSNESVIAVWYWA